MKLAKKATITIADKFIYEGDIDPKTNEPHGFGVIRCKNNTFTFSGHFVQGKREGYGVLSKKEGVYKGEFKNDLFDGNGEYTTKDDTYKGNFSKGAVTGKGTSIRRDGQVYIGEWLDGKRHGQGVFKNKKGDTFSGIYHMNALQYGTWKFANGDSYEGTFANDKKDGFGTLKLTSGTYVGHFVKDYFCGSGKLTTTYGVTYEGQFKGGKLNGKAKCVCPDEYTHEGMYVNNEKNGFGKIVFANGQTYEGFFENDLYNGEGVLYFSDKKTFYKGTWKDGNMNDGIAELHSKDVVRHETYIDGVRQDVIRMIDTETQSTYDGTYDPETGVGKGLLCTPTDSYEGEILHFEKHGFGKLVDTRGNIYMGIFEYGLFEGLGTLIEKESGDVYTGSFHKQLLHGSGRVFHVDSSTGEMGTLSGFFRNGLKEGVATICIDKTDENSELFQIYFVNDMEVFSTKDDANPMVDLTTPQKIFTYLTSRNKM